MDVGQRIREVREDLGMQATVLARRTGVAPNTIYRIEAGERMPSVALLERIAAALRTEPAELFREPSEAIPKASAPPKTGPPALKQAVSNELEYGLPPTLMEDFERPFERIVEYERAQGFDDGAISKRMHERVDRKMAKLEAESSA